MYVVIMGCGRLGSTLAHNLEARGHSVAVIDQNADAFRRLGADFTGFTVTGIGFDNAVLREAGIERADAFAAVSSGDNSNIISARLARETFGVSRVVARIYDQRRAQVYERLGIPTVATVSWATDQVLRRLMPGEVKADWADPSGKICVVERGLPVGWAGKKLSGLNEPGRFWLTAVTRLGAARVVDTGFVGQEGDVLTFTAGTDALDALTERLESGKDH